MEYRGTTILAVRTKGAVAIGGDGQVTLGDHIVKREAKKIRRLHGGKVIVGFAGATADAFALLERFEKKLETFQGNIVRSATELAKDWRMDRSLRRLESLLIAVDEGHILLVSGSGDVIEPDDDVIGIGSGGAYAASAAKALLRHTKLTAKEIVAASLKIASEVCIYTNDSITVEEIK